MEGANILVIISNKSIDNIMELPECHFCIQINCVKILCRYVTYEFKLSRINLFQKRQISTLGIDIVK